MRLNDIAKQKNGFKGALPEGESNVKFRLLSYASALLRGANLTEELLEFVLSLFDSGDLKAFRDGLSETPSAAFMFLNQQKGRTDDDPEAAESRLDRDLDRILTKLEKLSMTYSKHSVERIEKKVRGIIKEILDRKQETFVDVIPHGYPEALTRLAADLRLSEEEQALVMCFLCLEVSNPFMSLLEQFDSSGRFRFIAEAADLPLDRVKSLLREEEKLRALGVLECTNYRAGSDNFMRLREEITAFLLSIRDSYIGIEILRKDTKETFPVETFGLPESALSLIMAILRGAGNGNMLFYGSPGTGKTEFARSIVKEAGKEAWLLQYSDGRNLRRRFEDFRTACALMPAETGVLIVDEADGLLNTVGRFFFSSGEETDKGLLNTLLDEHGKTVIWICNRTGGMEDSTLRRFSYSLCFGKNTIKQRQRYWNTLVRAHKLDALLTETEIAKLARRYEINVGHIAYALEAWDALNGQAGEEGKPHPPGGLADDRSLSPLNALTDILDRQQELLGKGRIAAGPVHCNHDLFDPAFLNTEPGLDAMVRAVSGAAVSNGSHFLFYGPPGTGKSECARHLAAVMDREFIAKRTSDIMSPYVGENERNIRDIFAEAEDAVLCLDEADSFFRDRGRARQSWEVSFTNEFLTQMESFKGVLVCSTNFLDLLDGAVLRRFAWKVRFLPLRKEQRAELVRRYFGFRDLIDDEKQLFTAIDDLTAGDIKAVRLRYGDVSAAGGAGYAEAGGDVHLPARRLLMGDIARGLTEECRLRTKDSPLFASSGKKSIGFTA